MLTVKLYFQAQERKDVEKSEGKKQSAAKAGGNSWGQEGIKALESELVGGSFLERKYQ